MEQTLRAELRKRGLSGQAITDMLFLYEEEAIESILKKEPRLETFEFVEALKKKEHKQSVKDAKKKRIIAAKEKKKDELEDRLNTKDIPF